MRPLWNWQERSTLLLGGQTAWQACRKYCLEDKQSVDRQDKGTVLPYLTILGRIRRAEDPFYVVQKRGPSSTENL